MTSFAVSKRRNLPVDNPDLALENHSGRAKLWMTEGTKSVKCRGVGVFVKLYFHVLYSACQLEIETPLDAEEL